MGWLGSIARVATTAAVGNASGRQKGDEQRKEELRQALEVEARKRAEGREEQRLRDAQQARADSLLFRKEDSVERAEDRDADRDLRERTYRENREARAAEQRERSLDRRAVREQTAASRGEETPAQKRAARLRSAKGNAQAWAEGGRSAEAIAGALKGFYPDVSLGELRGISIEAVRAMSRSARRAPADADDWDKKYPAEPGDPGYTPPQTARPASQAPTLSASDRARAQRDPEFRRWLIDKGHQP